MRNLPEWNEIASKGNLTCHTFLVMKLVLIDKDF